MKFSRFILIVLIVPSCCHSVNYPIFFILSVVSAGGTQSRVIPVRILHKTLYRLVAIAVTL